MVDAELGILDSGELEMLEDFNRQLATHYDRIAGSVENEVDVEMASVLRSWRQDRARIFASMAAERELAEIDLVERLAAEEGDFDDPLAPARGVAIALLFSVVFFALLGFLIYVIAAG